MFVSLTTWPVNFIQYLIRNIHTNKGLKAHIRIIFVLIPDEKGNRSAGQGNKKRMFLLRMLLGNSYICKDPNPHKYRRPPCTSCFKDDCKDTRHEDNKFGHMFNSVVGDNGKLFREFVVYDGSVCYPEYLITYERR